MIHPDFNKVAHLAPLKREADAYRLAYRDAARSGQQHADAWSPVKAQETRLNLAVEKALAGF